MRRLLACTACLFAVSTTDAAHLRWQTQAGVIEAGFRGVVTADLDGDGRDEAVFTAGPSSDATTLGVVARDGGALALTQLLWVDQTLSGNIVAARVGGGDRILVGTDDYYGGRQLIEFGGLPLRELRRLPMPQWMRPLAVADIDGDGDLDILALVAPYYHYDAAVALLDYATGVTLWTEEAIATGAVAAQLDADPALEIIVAGTIGRVLDGATRLQEWSYPAGFRSQLFVGEFDGGTTSREFAAMDTYGGPLTLFRAAPYSPLRDTLQPSSYGLLAAVDDIDNDGRDEILQAGAHLEGGSIAYTPSTDTTRSFPHEGLSPDGVASSNLFGTAASELVLTSSPGWYGQTDAVRVVDTATNAVRLSIPQAAGPYAALALGDVDADGRADVVHALSQRGSDPDVGHLVCMLDAASGERRGCITQEGFYWEVPTIAPFLGRFTPTAGDDIAVIQGSAVTVFDGASNALQWQRTDLSPGYSGIAASAAMRFDADAIDDPVLLDYAGRVHVLDGRNGETLWTSVALGGGSELTLTVANVDADPATELLVSTDNALYAFDAQTRLLDWSHKPDLQVGRVVVWGSGAACRLGLYDPAGRFQAVRCSDRSNVGDEREFPANANLLRVLDPAAEHFVAATAGRIVTIAADDSVREWASGLGPRLGNNNAGVVIALGGNRYDVIVGSDTTVVRVAIHPDLLFEDAFE